MNLPMLTNFFMWCTLINGGILLLWTGIYFLAPELLYRTPKRWFTGSRETSFLYGDVLFRGIIQTAVPDL